MKIKISRSDVRRILKWGSPSIDGQDTDADSELRVRLNLIAEMNGSLDLDGAPVCAIFEPSPAAARSHAISGDENFLDQAVSVDGHEVIVSNVYMFRPGQVVDVHGSEDGFPLFGWVAVARTGRRNDDGSLNHYDANVIEVSGALRIKKGDILMTHNPRHPSYLANAPQAAIATPQAE